MYCGNSHEIPLQRGLYTITQMVSQKPLILILSLNLAGHAIHSIINGHTFSQNDLGMSNIRLL